MLFDITGQRTAYAQELGINYELDMNLPFAQDCLMGYSQKIYITGCGASVTGT